MHKEAIAEALYNHWKSSSYELKRQPVFAESDANIRRVFESQAEALISSLKDKGVILVTLPDEESGV